MSEVEQSIEESEEEKQLKELVINSDVPERIKPQLVNPDNIHTIYSNGEYITVDIISGVEVGSKGVGQILDKFVLKPELAHHICNLISEGLTIRKALMINGMPDRALFNKWRRASKDFDNMVTAALEDRADVIHDEIMDIAEDAKGATKDDVAGLKLRVDILKWGAEVGNKKRYTPKSNNSDAVAMPNITIKIDTGSRELDNMRTVVNENGELEGFDYGEEDSITI